MIGSWRLVGFGPLRQHDHPHVHFAGLGGQSPGGDGERFAQLLVRPGETQQREPFLEYDEHHRILGGEGQHVAPVGDRDQPGVHLSDQPVEQLRVRPHVGTQDLPRRVAGVPEGPQQPHDDLLLLQGVIVSLRVRLRRKL